MTSSNISNAVKALLTARVDTSLSLRFGQATFLFYCILISSCTSLHCTVKHFQKHCPCWRLSSRGAGQGRLDMCMLQVVLLTRFETIWLIESGFNSIWFWCEIQEVETENGLYIYDTCMSIWCSGGLNLSEITSSNSIDVRVWFHRFLAQSLRKVWPLIGNACVGRGSSTRVG